MYKGSHQDLLLPPSPPVNEPRPEAEVMADRRSSPAGCVVPRVELSLQSSAGERAKEEGVTADVRRAQSSTRSLWLFWDMSAAGCALHIGRSLPTTKEQWK